MKTLAGAIRFAVLIALPAAGWAQAPGPPLALDTKIALGAVSGRIDHLAVDLKRQQLFVAELGNDSLGVVNIAARKMRSTMPGLKEPQGIGYEPSADIVYAANAGDGSVRLLWAEDLTSKGRIDQGFPQVPVVCFMVRARSCSTCTRARCSYVSHTSSRHYSHPRSPNAERSTPGGAYHPVEP